MFELLESQSVVSSPGQLLEAKALLEEAGPRFNIRLNCTCYNPVIKAAGEIGNTTMVYELYQRLKTVRALLYIHASRSVG